MTIFVILIFVSSCSKEEDITLSATFFDRTFPFEKCNYWHNSNEIDEVIIRSQKEYESFFADKKNPHANDWDCNNAELPEIDFTKHSLIGKRQ